MYTHFFNPIAEPPTWAFCGRCGRDLKREYEQNRGVCAKCWGDDDGTTIVLQAKTSDTIAVKPGKQIPVFRKGDILLCENEKHERFLFWVKEEGSYFYRGRLRMEVVQNPWSHGYETSINIHEDKVIAVVGHKTVRIREVSQLLEERAAIKGIFSIGRKAHAPTVS